MSFQDLEAGYVPRKGDLLNGGQDPSQAVASGVFEINTSVTSFTRLINQLGTVKDTPELREKLHKTRQHILQLIKGTSAKLKTVSENDHSRPVSASRKVGDARLAKDFQTVLQLFEKAQRLSSERESAYAPFVPQAVLPESYTSSPDDNYERRALLTEQRRQEVMHLENEVSFNEAVIEERAQGIREVQEQIEEVHEIFRDLAVLVHEQGTTIEDIDSHIESSYSATAQANRQLGKASQSQKSGNTLSCLLLVIFGVALVIVIIVIAA